jgi:hypothetical protein
MNFKTFLTGIGLTALVFCIFLWTNCGGAGTGTTPPPVTHSVTLSWTEKTPGCTFTLYSSRVSGGPYEVRLANTTTTTFVYSGVAAGDYYFVVDAALNGKTARSNEFHATP